MSGSRSDRSHHSNGSSRHSRRSSQTAPSSPRAAIREFLSGVGLPSGLLSSVLQSYDSCDSRLWLLDNSHSMMVRDSHVGRTINKEGRGEHGMIERMDNVTRWEELQECVAFHAKMASRCWIPSKYWLVNDEKDGNHKFGLCWSTKDDVRDEMAHVKHVMKTVALDQKRCPLASRLHALGKGISKEVGHLESRSRHVTLVVCTQGLPTDKRGETSSAVRREFQHELSKFGKLPVKVIVRLCTDDEKVRDMFNTMDSRFDAIDVLDDYWGEALEVYLHNPWLTYGMGLHRLREAGLAPEVIDDLDERPLNADELHEFCTMLFVGEDGLIHLPHPTKGWNNFLRALTVLVEKERTQWNPVKKCNMPWINLKKLNAMKARYVKEGGGVRTNSQESHGTRHTSQERHGSRHAHHGGQQHQQQQQQQRRSSLGDPPSSRGRAPDPPRPKRQTYTGRPTSSNGHGHGTTGPCTKDLALPEVLKRWSHQPPDHESTYYPLEHLLVTVPQTFPPVNTKVEAHVYFAKWKEIDREAFADESGDELKELLKRAVRKAKFFLHPDKLPKDLTENQALLFRTIWDVLQEKEESTLG